MISAATKTLFLCTALATGSTALATALFHRYSDGACSRSSALGRTTVTETYCVDVEDISSSSYDAFVTEACAIADSYAVVQLFGAPGCEAEAIESFVVSNNPQCVTADVTVRSLSLYCSGGGNGGG